MEADRDETTHTQLARSTCRQGEQGKTICAEKAPGRHTVKANKDETAVNTFVGDPNHHNYIQHIAEHYHDLATGLF